MAQVVRRRPDGGWLSLAIYGHPLRLTSKVASNTLTSSRP